MRDMNRLICSVIILFCLHFAGAVGAGAQNVFEQTVSFDKIVHDFGDIMMSDGPQKCSFKVKNISDRPIVIHRVLTSCGCTEPTWTQEPIRPGGTGEIQVVFSNDQGPYPFSKSVTVYVSGLSKPVILKVKGVVHDKPKSLSELFPVASGPLGFREGTVSMGQIEQGLARIGDARYMIKIPVRENYHARRIVTKHTCTLIAIVLRTYFFKILFVFCDTNVKLNMLIAIKTD